jgi:ubiquitin C-terminal hydrolase
MAHKKLESILSLVECLGQITSCKGLSSHGRFMHTKVKKQQDSKKLLMMG